MSESRTSWLPPILCGLLLLGLWYGIKAAWQIPIYFLPAPHEILQALWAERTVLARATLTTLLGSSLGFAAATVFGIGMALLLASSRWLRAGLYPYIVVMQMVPILATAAIIVIWLDVGLLSVATIAFLIGFFPVVASTLQGLSSVPERQVELFRLYRAKPWQELLLLRLPASLPYVFTGTKIAATLAVIGSVTGEIFAGSSSGGGGLGFMIVIYKSSLKIPALFAATLLCCLLGYAFVALVLRLRRWALQAWHESELQGGD